MSDAFLFFLVLHKSESSRELWARTEIGLARVFFHLTEKGQGQSWTGINHCLYCCLFQVFGDFYQAPFQVIESRLRSQLVELGHCDSLVGDTLEGLDPTQVKERFHDALRTGKRLPEAVIMNLSNGWCKLLVGSSEQSTCAKNVTQVFLVDFDLKYFDASHSISWIIKDLQLLPLWNSTSDIFQNLGLPVYCACYIRSCILNLLWVMWLQLLWQGLLLFCPWNKVQWSLSFCWLLATEKSSGHDWKISLEPRDI